jgi:hypothetical protein
MLKDIIASLWALVMAVMSLQIPLAEYTFTFLELFIYGFLFYIVLWFLFGLGSKGGTK